MQLKIGEKDYTLTFGIGFLREVDKRRSIEVQGVRMGMGLNCLIPALMGYDILAAYDTIKAATADLDSKPSSADIEAFLGSAKVEKLCDDFLTQLEKAPLTKRVTKAIRTQATE